MFNLIATFANWFQPFAIALIVFSILSMVTWQFIKFRSDRSSNNTKSTKSNSKKGGLIK